MRLLNLLLFSWICLQWLCLMAGAEPVVREDSVTFANKRFPLVYKWQPKFSSPKAVVIAVHGLILHGLTFNTLAQHLASSGILVLAPDLRGYGRWCKSAHTGKSSTGYESAPVAYEESRQDLVELLLATKNSYPNLPLFFVGESLGADLALYAATQKPDLIDGLILSNPAIKHRVNIIPRLLTDSVKIITNPTVNLDLTPYMKQFASEDPRITAEAINDPLVRRRMRAWDLIKTKGVMNRTLKDAEKVPATIPILFMQSSKDKVLYADSLLDLLDNLNSSDQTVKWFKGRGHLMLETAYVQKDTLETIDTWLWHHIHKQDQTDPGIISQFLAPPSDNQLLPSRRIFTYTEAEAETN